MIKKILFVSIFKEGDGGGEGRVAYEMARYFSHHYQVVMLCPGETTGLSVEGNGRPSNHDGRPSNYDGFKRFQVQSTTGQGNIYVPLLSAVNVTKIFKFLDEFQPDVIHVHDPALMGVISQVWAKHNQVPIFYTAHLIPSRVLDFGTNEALHLISGPVNEGLVERYLLNFYETCDGVVGLNQIVADEIREFGYTGKLFLIPNGRNLALYHTCRFADPSTEEKTLTFTGFLSKRKNQVFLLEMMKYLPANFRLILIGEPLVPGYLQELSKIAREKHLKVEFTGQLIQKDIAAWLEKTHVFVSASKMEVQSLVIIEALASGTPVVGLSNETVDELVDDSDGIRLPKDTEARTFAAAVEKLCNLPEKEYRSLCENARRKVNDLDWSNIMQKTIHSYEEVVADKTRQPESMQNSELVHKVIAQLPPGILCDDLTEIIATIPTPHKIRPKVRARTLWSAWLNMSLSMAAYLVLKGPVYVIRKLGHKK